MICHGVFQGSDELNGEFIMGMVPSRIVSIEEVGEADTWDILNLAPDVYRGEGNFLIDNAVVHNSIPEYIERRDDDRQSWRKHEDERIVALLEETFGVIVYQEQLQAVWQVLAGFTSPQAQEARKAVAKKWREKLKPIEAMWMAGATKTLGAEAAAAMWQKMVTFGRYAFNKCLDAQTNLTDLRTGVTKTVQEWAESDCLPIVLESLDCGMKVTDECVVIHENDVQEVFEVEFDNGQIERVTIQHQFLCSDGEYHTVGDIYYGGLDVIGLGSSRCHHQAREQVKS